jgi:ketosteroid isomerase-like protein
MRTRLPLGWGSTQLGARGCGKVLDLSEQNAAVVRRLYRAVNENDLSTFLELMHPDVELTTSGVYPDFRPIYRGHKGARDYWQAVRGVWDNVSIEIRRCEPIGHRVLALVSQRVEGRDGIVAEHDWGHVFELADGLIRRGVAYASWEAGIEAAGAESGVRGD